MADMSKKQRYGILRALSVSSQLGITMVACIAIGVFLGRFLDNLLGTAPWLLLLFSLLGVVAALRTIINLSKKK